MIRSKIYIPTFAVFIVISFVTSSSALMPDSTEIFKILGAGSAYDDLHGTASGTPSKYSNPLRINPYMPQIRHFNQLSRPQPIIVTPNFRATGIETRRRGPFQIYKLPGVIAPGVVGTFSQIGY